MSWRKSIIFAVDRAAVLTGVLIAAPLVLILTAQLGLSTGIWFYGVLMGTPS